MKKLVLMLILVMVFSSQCFGEAGVIRKDLGDINGDGKKEVAVEKETSGSMVFTDVQIQTNNKTILVLPTLCGDSADGYKIIGKQIVVWRGDWNAENSKWKPHYYDFTWYRWNRTSKKFEIVHEGFTKKSYDYKQAVGTMPKLTVRSAKNIILSNKATFANDAVALAVKKFGQGLRVRSVRKEQEEWVNDLYPDCVHYFYVSLWSEERSVLVSVMFLRDGRYELNATT